MALYKLCRCGKRIEYTEKYCTDCMKAVKEEKKDRVKHYDKNVRYSKENKKYTQFYNSKPWKTLSDIVKRNYHGLCVTCEVSRKENQEITLSDTTHHIEELKERWDLRLMEDNLIPLCHDCHNKLHANYKEKDKIRLRNAMEEFKNLY